MHGGGRLGKTPHVMAGPAPTISCRRFLGLRCAPPGNAAYFCKARQRPGVTP